MTVRHTRIGAAVAGLAIGALVLSGCGGASQDTASNGKIKVVASTNVWGSVAQAIGGDAVEVKSLIEDPSADPHSYDSKPTDAVALNDAKVAIYNGGGYDEFFTKLLGSAGKDAKKIAAFDLSGKPAGGNEHVWYDLTTVRKVADSVAEQLTAVAPDKKDTFAGNAKEFDGKLDALLGKAKQLGVDHPGSKAVVTEPVPDYLLAASGVQDVTPAEFAKAIEQQTDPSAAAVAQTGDLIAGRQVAVLVNNTQTESTITRQLTDKAGTARVPVVGVTETLPAGVAGYLDWMTKQVDELAKALAAK
ncbi:metal ABC transporter substrate-binding protein [Solihabitans fulvus]|uniref:Metal ABC transporter substrate-binding protein n=1 Tax=Solihabitans fulvus TaxID=1892852 RepID=A0A5B2XGQ6_9PSEU|nr:zinc ABC transporter substrate-binding protein [Solihabitans fulvus]KAA2262344.1 metal ABC transporter substrate-binding protein [Solihabitans fulvus]